MSNLLEVSPLQDNSIHFPIKWSYFSHFLLHHLWLPVGSTSQTEPSTDTSTELTGCLHHAGPKLRLLVERVIIGATELVDMHARWSAHAAVVADEHVKILQRRERRVRGARSFISHIHSPCSSQTKAPSSHLSSNQDKGRVSKRYWSCLGTFPVSQETGAPGI